jgi:integrase
MNTDLRAAVSSHLAARRARGYRLEGREQLLGAFLDSMKTRGETRITVPAALAFATAPAGTARAWHAQRLAAVRSFAGYVHALDPAAADPVPGGLIPGKIARRVPYLYSGEETARLMAAAGTLASPVLAASMRTLIGLLASTGIRSGEAFTLDVSDLDTAAQVLTVTGKHGRSGSSRCTRRRPPPSRATCASGNSTPRTAPPPCSSATPDGASTATWPARSSGRWPPDAAWNPGPAAGPRDCTTSAIRRTAGLCALL